MTDLPILFSAPMVRALIAGRKTQTRRILNKKRATLATKIAPGDRLWVREAWRVSGYYDATRPADLEPRRSTVLFEAGGSIANQESGRWEPDLHYPTGLPAWAGRLRPGMFMPRWASRLTLTVTGVKVERLQDISAADAIAEGLKPETCAGQDMWDPGTGHGHFGDPRVAYHMLWDDINGLCAWDANPEVVAFTFTVRHHNIDAPEAP